MSGVTYGGDATNACRTTEETKSGGFCAEVRELSHSGCSTPPPSSSRRSMAATLSYTDPYADTLAPPSFANEGDGAEWCVDVGESLVTKSTLSLWEAIERGEVLASMRVWREGMECWTPAGELPELACAIARTPVPPRDPALSDGAPATSASRPSLTGTHEAPPESGVRTHRAPLASAVSRWIALGSAVSLAVIACALIVKTSPAAPVERAGSAPPLATPPLAPRPLAPSPLATPSNDDAASAAPSPSHHEERGQHRMPRGGGAAHGR